MYREIDYLASLLKELQALPNETEWVEFKSNLSDVSSIGEYISALSNAAALCGKTSAYLVWGVEDDTHELIGTDFKISTTRKGGEDLEPWLARMLDPRINFEVHEFQYDNLDFVILEIAKASNRPTKFSGAEYIRVGSHKKPLKDYPEKERALWKTFENVSFEEEVAVANVDKAEVLSLLDYTAYYELLGQRSPTNLDVVIEHFVADRFIQFMDNGRYMITNLGGILFAKNLADFPTLHRKAVRVIQYSGKNKLSTVREQVGGKGYAVGYEGLISFIDSMTPTEEVIEKGIRKSIKHFPEIAIREVVANALIHQDFRVGGTGPTIEIYADRMEIANPGKPLMSTERLLDSPPQSRNERLASFMRRIGICEERGSGIDKTVFAAEAEHLPAPTITVISEHTIVTLFKFKTLKEMERHEKQHACYMHASLQYVSKEYLTNSSLKERFGATDSSAISRIIKDAVESGKIKALDPDTAPRYMKYIPYWA